MNEQQHRLSALTVDPSESHPADWTWAGSDVDPVITSEKIAVAGTVMLLQVTQSGQMLLNGKVVEPAAKAAR